MKRILLFLLAAFLFASCSQQRYCQPSKRSRDYAVRQWVKQERDGYYTVTTILGFSHRTVVRYECLPDSATLVKL